MATPRHPSLHTPFFQRAEAAAHPLTAYLFRLMDLKASNLCLSADVTTARELLLLADRVGPFIVVLKTHYDIVSGWDYNPQTGTGAQLAALARKHGFLIFEDRKFADIGKTGQQQYTAGTARIIEWAHLVTVNMDAGAAAVTALADAAAHWRERVHYEVRTSVTVGTPVHESFHDVFPGGDSGTQQPTVPSDNAPLIHFQSPWTVNPGSLSEHLDTNASEAGTSLPALTQSDANGRKGSIVSVTTVTQHFEPVESPRLPRNDSSGGGCNAGSGSGNAEAGVGAGAVVATANGTNATGANSTAKADARDELVFPGIEEAPLERGILLLAQMSTKGNLMSSAYTQACVETARANKSFVVGFIAQECLNTLPDDAFVHLTPGCKLPPPGEDGALAGDGMGQQYNTPARLIGECGSDIVIVGRGIITAGDPPSEAERYRRKAWKAYTARLQ